MPYEITLCYLPPGRGDFPDWLSQGDFTPAEAGTRFSDPGAMQGSADCKVLTAVWSELNDDTY